MRSGYRLMMTLAVCLVAHGSPAFAAGWSCRNNDLEVTCSSKQCWSSEAFTPMHIGLSGKTLIVCAYSGCWEGQAVVMARGDFVYASRSTLKWSGKSKSPGQFQLVIEKSSKTGMILGEGFANPLVCEAS